MNVQKVILNRTIRQYGIFFAGIGVAMIGQHACENAVINDIKTEIMAKYPEKYNQINKKAMNLPLVSRKLYWNKALISLEDSARIAGEAQKAYLKGAKMINDANKIVKNN